MASTGSTQGMRFRIRPPSRALASASSQLIEALVPVASGATVAVVFGASGCDCSTRLTGGGGASASASAGQLPRTGTTRRTLSSPSRSTSGSDVTEASR